MRVIVTGLMAIAIGSSSVPTVKQEPRTKTAMLCFLKGEQSSGLNKICFYDCAGSAAAITVSASSLCPISIDH